MFQTDTEIYVDQSAATLRHTVVAGELNLNQFNILVTDRMHFQTPQFILTGRIIGASHLLTFKIGSQQYHEIFACTDFIAEGEEIASYGPLGKVSARVNLILDGGSTYTFHSQTLDFETAWDWLANFEERAIHYGRKGNEVTAFGLHYNFPRDEITGQIPKTIMLARFEPASNRVKIETAHSYPNEQKIVCSESILKFSEGR